MREYFEIAQSQCDWVSHSPSAHLSRLLDCGRHQERESASRPGRHLFHLILYLNNFSFFIQFLSGGHGPCRPQWRSVHPHRLHPPPHQWLLLLLDLLQDLLPHRPVWCVAWPRPPPCPPILDWAPAVSFCQVKWPAINLNIIFIACVRCRKFIAFTVVIVLFSRSSTDPDASSTAVATLGKVGQQPPIVGEVENEKSNSRFPFFALSCSCSCINHCPT